MGYCTVQDLRDEGITEAQANDARLAMLIALATGYIDLITRRWFEPRTLALKLDGSGHDTLWLPAPIIELTAVKVDGRTAADTALTVYDRRVPDDRNNPKVVYCDGYPKGKQNVEVTGSFGYTEADGKTPALIKRAAMQLVIRDIPKLTDNEAQEDRKRARIISETTDKHSYTLAQLASNGEWSGDAEIDNALYFYMAPPRAGSV